MNPSIRRLLVALTASLAVTVGGAVVVDLTVDTGKKTSSDQVTGDPTASNLQLDISDFAFKPPALSVKAGTPFKVTNQDGAKHTVTSGPRGAPDGTFDLTLAGGDTGTIKIDTPGSYAYVCNIHPGMKGTIEVTP